MRNLVALTLVFLIACGMPCDLDGWVTEGSWDQCRATAPARLRKSIAVQKDFPVRFIANAWALSGTGSIEMAIGSARWPVHGYTIVDTVITQTSDVILSGTSDSPSGLSFIVRSVSLLPREP